MNFLYEATDESGKTILGRIDAPNELEVQRQLHQLGYRPQAIAPVQPTAAAPSVGQEMTLMQGVAAPAMPRSVTLTGQSMAAQTGNQVGGITLAGNAARVASKANRVKTGQGALVPGTAPASNASKLGGVTTREMMFFFQQFTSLARSGINLYSALEDLGNRTKNANLARTIKEMAEQARAGGRISDVMEHYPRIYPEHIVGLVRAGELGGFLDVALAEITLNYEQNIALYRGSWIPKMMATQAFFMLALVIPLFRSLYAADLNAGVFLQLYLKQITFIYLPIAFALYWGVKIAGRRLQLPQFRHLRDGLSLKLPPFGELQRQSALAAFVRMLRRLYHAGVAPIHAWEAAMCTATNVVIRDKLSQSYELMQQGATLPDAFAATGLFTDSVEQLIVTGHQSGEVVESLDKIADYYQDRIDEAAGKSKFMMLRLGLIGMVLFGGGAMLWMFHTYYAGMFQWVDMNFGD